MTSRDCRWHMLIPTEHLHKHTKTIKLIEKIGNPMKQVHVFNQLVKCVYQALISNGLTTKYHRFTNWSSYAFI